MPVKKPDPRLTNAVVLLGTAAVAFIPLYITRFHAAIEDGALLLVGSVFASDAIFRCASPRVERTNRVMLVLVLAAVLLALTISEYSPIAERLVEQDHAVDAWIHQKDPAPLRRFREYALAREQRKQDSVRNDSVVLLLFSLLTDLGVILLVKDYGKT
jgi:Ca2+/Na+ antiporter